MAIQMRHGPKANFDPQKMLPGEWAVSIDQETENQIVWMCFRAGVVKRMGTYEDFKEQITEIADEIAKEYKETFNEIKVYMEGLRDTTEGYKDATKTYMDTTEGYKDTSVQKAAEALQSATNASQSATNSANSADLSEDYSLKSKSYAVGTGGEVRPNDDSDCAEYYYEQVKRISQGIPGIIPMGTITFAELSLEINEVEKYMFNISDEFVSDERFKNGSGIYYGAGSNVVRTGDGMWDVLAAPSVSGVKGDKETVYRQGFVNLTPEDIGAATMEDLKGVNADFVGTKEELEEKLQSGEVTDGMTAYVTNDDSGGEGGGTSGTMDYNDLDNKPSINGETLQGNKTLTDLGIQQSGDYALESDAGNSLSVSTDTETNVTTISLLNKLGETLSTEEIESSGSSSVMTGATSSAAGSSGLVPAPAAGKQNSFLRGDGSWWGYVTAGLIGNSTLGSNSTAEGYHVKASGMRCHAEGDRTESTGYAAHSEGAFTIASGSSSHAEGSSTQAIGHQSHAEGNGNIASNTCSHACGHYCASMSTGGETGNTVGTALAIGNGTSESAKSNAFSVMFTGVVKAKSTITASTTADYAEFFEWKDGNPNKEDRVGRFVTLDGNKIEIANTNEEYILGIISGEPFVLGNGDCDTWNGMYLKDEFNRTIYEPAPKLETDELTGELIIDEKTGKSKILHDEDGNVIYEGTRPKLNPEYNSEKKYVSRFDRPEWSPVGMLGALSVLQDGTCKVNGYCCCTNGGIATACNEAKKNSCRVIEIISKDVARVIFK